MPRQRTSQRTLTGLDIEPSFIAAVEARNGERITVARAATAPLDAGVVRDGEVTDVDALAEALRDFFRQHGFDKRVRLGLANQRIVVRTIELPPLINEKELDAAVRFQAEDQIPMPLDQAVLDYQSLGAVETSDGPRIRAVLVAARRDMVDRLLSAARRAGLRPEGVDLSAFAMIRALDPGAQRPEGAVLYLSVGGMTNLALADGSRCVFTRVVPGGVEQMTAELAERCGLTLEHARQWLVHVGLARPVEDVEGEAGIVVAARAVLSEGARRVADEARNSIHFSRAQELSAEVGRVVLTGLAVAIPGFAEQLAADLGLRVEPGIVPEATPGAHSGVHAGRLTVAAGLAVAERAA